MSGSMSKGILRNLPLLGLWTTIGCGPGSVPEADPFACVDMGSLCVTLNVPEDYSGTPRELATGFYDTSDTARPPNESLAAIEYPSIIAGEEYLLSHENIDFDGDFYMLFILFDEDGGIWIPQTGIDYTATTPQPISLDGNPIELGTLNLVMTD